MFESQASSNSATSRSSVKKEDVSVFPEKFRRDSVLLRKVFFSDDQFQSQLLQAFSVMITSQCEVIECNKSGEITNYLNLQCHFPDELQIAKTENVDMEIIISDDSVLYAVKINSMLFGIERKKSQLKLLKVLTKVNSFNRVVDENSGDISILVIFDDNKQQLTKFLDNELEDFMRNKNSSRFNSVFEYVTQKTAAAQIQLDNLTSEIEEMSLKLQQEISATMLQDVSDQHRLAHPEN